MRRLLLSARLIALATVLLSAPVLSGCYLLWLAEEVIGRKELHEEVSDVWVCVEHPELPITFELPENAVWSMSFQMLGKSRSPTGLWGPEWGVRAVFREAHDRLIRYALSVEFHRLPNGFAVSPESVRGMIREIDSGERAVAFVKNDLSPREPELPGAHPLPVVDEGTYIILGRPARRLSIKFEYGPDLGGPTEGLPANQAFLGADVPRRTADDRRSISREVQPAGRARRDLPANREVRETTGLGLGLLGPRLPSLERRGYMPCSPNLSHFE